MSEKVEILTNLKCPKCGSYLVPIPKKLAKDIAVNKNRRPQGACILCRTAFFIEETTTANFEEYDKFLDESLAEIVALFKRRPD